MPQNNFLCGLLVFLVAPFPCLLYLLSGARVPSSWHNLYLWAWYVFMVLFGVVANSIILLFAWRYIKPKDKYSSQMKFLALPWVWECAWRSAFPSLYLQRFAFWDTPLNAIIVDRTWACIGELAFTCQVAFALMQVDRDIACSLGRSCRAWIQCCGWLAILTYVVAECVSYYNVATTNEWWAAAEVFMDALAFVVMAPAVFFLFFQCPGSIKASSAKVYLLAMCIYTVAFPMYNFCIDVPMYMARYREDQAHHKKYFHFWEGILDASERRIVTHQLEDWRQDMLWMALYFIFGAWAGIALMFAPRLPNLRDSARAMMLREMLEDEPSSLTNEELSAEITRLQLRISKLQTEALSRLASASGQTEESA